MFIPAKCTDWIKYKLQQILILWTLSQYDENKDSSRYGLENFQDGGLKSWLGWLNDFYSSNYPITLCRTGWFRCMNFTPVVNCLWQVDNVKMVERFRTRHPAVGTLYLTTTHLIFVDSAGKRETWVSSCWGQESGGGSKYSGVKPVDIGSVATGFRVG